MWSFALLSVQTMVYQWFTNLSLLSKHVTVNVEERNTDIDMIDHADEHKLIWKIVEDNHDNNNSIMMMHIFTVKVQVINENSMIYEKRIKMI